MKPLVSIVIPVYNSEPYLDETVQSILKQTYTNWEAIFVDDASTDGSLDVIRKYQKNNKNIIIIHSKTNHGAGITRNKGIKRAKGKYICFLDADDFWEDKKLEKQVKFMEDNNYSFTFTGYVFTNEKGESTGARVKVPYSINYKGYLKNTIIWTSTVMINVEKISKELIYMPDIRTGQDGATWIKILKNIDFAYGLNEQLSYYRRTRNSISSNKFKAVLRVWNLYRNFENFGILKSSYYFVFYLFNTIKKRIKFFN